MTNMFEKEVQNNKVKCAVHCLKILYIFVLLLPVTVILLWMTYPNRSPDKDAIIQYPSKQLLIYECCTAQNATYRENIIFIKTHKTGGSTVQNVLFRFGERQNLHFLLPLYTAYYLPLTNFSLYIGSQTTNHKYNILASHLRYSSKIKKHMYPDVATITILRDPLSRFESMYNFFGLQITNGLTFKQFLRLPVKPPILLSAESHYVHRGYNGMSFDLGLEMPYFNNKSAVNEFIRRIDREFDFIMIMEYFEASMVLLANLMGWPLENVTYLTINKRAYKKNYILTEKDELEVSRLNYADTLLYNHFLLKFRKCMAQYGIERLNHDVKRLRMLNQQFKQRCAKKENTAGLLGTVSYSLKNYSDVECLRGIRIEPEYELLLMESQRIKMLMSKFKQNTSLKTQ